MNPKDITSKFKFTIKIGAYRSGAVSTEWYNPDAKVKEDIEDPSYFIAEGYVLDPLYAKHYDTEQEAVNDVVILKEKLGDNTPVSVHFFDPSNPSTWSMGRRLKVVALVAKKVN